MYLSWQGLQGWLRVTKNGTPGPCSPAEDVGIVLLEAAHARQPLQGPAVLIAMQDAKVRKAQRELPVAACTIGKHEAVPCSGASR